MRRNVGERCDLERLGNLGQTDCWLGKGRQRSRDRLCTVLAATLSAGTLPFLWASRCIKQHRHGDRLSACRHPPPSLRSPFLSNKQDYCDGLSNCLCGGGLLLQGAASDQAAIWAWASPDTKQGLEGRERSVQLGPGMRAGQVTC